MLFVSKLWIADKMKVFTDKTKGLRLVKLTHEQLISQPKYVSVRAIQKGY